MIQDKLSAEQRVRLEAVAQANIRLGARLGGSVSANVADLLFAAELIERYIIVGSKDDETP